MGVTQLQTAVEAKEQRLRGTLEALPSVIVALSGGTDSAYLAWVAHQVLREPSVLVGRGFSVRSGDPEHVEGNPR